MKLTKEDAQKFGIAEELVGSNIVFQYQKTGGILVCSKCGKYLGTPKHGKSGVIIYSPIRKKCPICGGLALIKCAEILRKPGTVTRATLRNILHGDIEVKVVLNKEDKYCKNAARGWAYAKILKKAARYYPGA